MHPSEHPAAARLAGPLGLAALALLGAGALATVGLGADVRGLGLLNAATTLAYAGPFALAYALGAFGLGRPLARLVAPASPSTHWVQLGLGLGVMLWLSHALGALGLLSGPGAAPRMVAWSPVALGLLVLAHQLARGALRPDGWPVVPPAVLLAAPALALLLVAALNPPGHLWASEAGGYDALSYHLQLPKEWLCGTALRPAQHNVYSYLPSFVEAAYLHLGAMVPGPSDPLARILGPDAVWVPACQLLHALFALAAAALAGRTAWTLALPLTDARTARTLGVIAAAFTLGVPWTVVTGSLPYNEAALLALTAAGLLIGVEPGLRPWARGLGCGLAIGLACGCKPTALFMAGPLVGLVMLRGVEPAPRPRGSRPAMIGAGSVAGIVAVAPWLARNALAGGNPVFPFAAGLFGTAHWTAEQASRFARHHHAPPGTTVVERLSRLFSTSYGLRHEQWAVTLPVLVLALAGALAWRRSRPAALVLAVGLLAQLACWLTLTHLESRFLLPILPTAALLAALAGAALVSRVRRPGAALAVLALVPLSCAAWTASLFVTERGGTPNRLLPFGVGTLTGLGPEETFRDAPGQLERMLEIAAPVQYVNLALRPQERVGAGVYLLGEATPLYLLGAVGEARLAGASPVQYHTTWDRSPLADIDPPPPGPRAGVHPWTRALLDRGVRFVVVNHDELRRLIDVSGYYDPGLTRPALEAWLAGPDLRRVRSWPREGAEGPSGTELYEIVAPTATGSPSMGAPAR